MAMNPNSAPKSKVKSVKDNTFAKGGSTKMFSQMSSEPSEAGVSMQVKAPKPGNNAPKGGGTGVMGKQRGAAPAVAGQVSPGGRAGDNSFNVNTGNGHMAPFTGSVAAKPR
jgi:hypothetical protein